MSELTDCTNSLTARDILRAIAKTANGAPFYLQTLGGSCSLLTPGQGTFAVDTESWTKYAANNMTRVVEGGFSSLKIEYVDNARGAFMYLRAASDLVADLTIGVDYIFTCRAKNNTGLGTCYIDLYNGVVYDSTWSNLTAVFAEYEFTFTAQSAAGCLIRMKNMGAGEIIYIDWWDLCPV